MTLDLLFSTYGDRISLLVQNLPKKAINTKIIIVHQVVEGQNYDRYLKKIEKRNDIKYVQSHSKGVARSRNIAIKNATSEIVLFCDDDVKYVSNISQLVVEAYHSNPNADGITFAYKKTNHQGIGRFSTKKYIHTKKSIFSIGTIEISCRRKHILDCSATFPENLGAGETLYLCDEPVFMAKLLKKENIIYVPSVVGEHPEIASGENWGDINAFKSRVMCFKYIFGKFFGVFVYYAFLIKNIKKIKRNTIFIAFYSALK